MEVKFWKHIEDRYSRFPASRAEPVAAEEFDEQIVRAGFPVDADYREFVLRHGGGFIGSLPIFGLRRPENMGLVAGAATAPEVTEGFKKLGWKEVDDWLIISADHGGNPIGIAPDGHIYVCDQTETFSVIKLGDNFEDFVRRECLRSP